MGKLFTLTHFLLEPECEDHSLLGQGVQEMEYALDFIFMDSINTSELDASLDESDVVLLHSLSVLYTQLIPFLIVLNHSLFPASNLIS